MPTSWSQCLCYLHYWVVSWLCDHITCIVYEEDKPPKIPYKCVTKNTEDEVFRYVAKPHLHPLNNHIFYLMTFMRYYDGKYTYTTWNHLYTQYLHKYWVIYHCFKLWCNLSWLRTLKKISRMKKWKQRREDHTTSMTNPVLWVVGVVWHCMPKLKRSLMVKLKKNSRKIWCIHFTNPDVNEENFHLGGVWHWWTMGGGSYRSTDFSQAEQRVSLHFSGHWCLFQTCMGSTH